MVGQINLGSKLGDKIFELASNPAYTSFVEIGTWNGEGSTKCFIDGLKSRDDDEWEFYSLESDRAFFDSATKYYGEFPEKYKEKINLIHGTILEDPVASMKDSGFDLDSLKEQQEYKPQYETFLANDLIAYQECPCVMSCIPEHIDVVLLDGGEFTTYAEFLALVDRTKVFILDDSNMLKTKKAKGVLAESSQWTLLLGGSDRNGFCIFEKSHS